MKLISFVLPALLVGSVAFAQEGAGTPPPAEAAASKPSAKAIKAQCKKDSNGDRKAYKKCVKDAKAQK